MNPSSQGGGRLRAYLEFLAAVVLFFVARSLARGWAQGLAQPQWTPLIEQAFLVLLLLLGYAGMGLRFDHQQRPISAQGLPGRPGWTSEAALGLAVGWAVAVACVLPLVVFGGIAIVLVFQPSAWGWLLADAVFFALAALAEEIAFRGYGFQRFIQAVGPLGAALGYAAFYAIMQALLPGSSHSSFAVSLALGLVLSTAYLRSGALWVSWGLNFGWKASRALIFGLAVSGVSNQSPVVQGNPMGPFWLTGGGFGLDASWWAFLVLLAALPVVYRLTSALNERYNTPEIVPGGIPVDLDAAARRQHEAAMGSGESATFVPAASGLVQIQPVSAPVAAPAAPPRDANPEQ
jgi:membrane protease YdiL (CAAX protease family)